MIKFFITFNEVVLTLFLFFIVQGVLAQEPSNDKNWQNLDLEKDNIFGISTERTYSELLNGKKAFPVIVAVIDGGIDITHDDLRNIIWVNPNEIPENRKDDDKNGYIDDVNGWNFLGSKKGSFLLDNAEIVRSLRAELKKDPNSKIVTELKQKVKNKRDGMIKAMERSNQRINVLQVILKKIGKDTPTLNELENFKYSNEPELNTLIYIVKTMKITGQDFSSFKEQLEEQYLSYKHHVEAIFNIDYEPRKNKDYQQEYHGNGNVQGLKGIESIHGTHIAGIIAASRDNGIGINGICKSAKIMAIRTVPEGDLLDEDMANAIRYAVDNGAKVINLSINKSSSPNKKLIDAAVQYAMDKDVLIIHAAGNDGRHEEDELDFPNRNYLTGTKASAWIEVGASGPKDNENLQAWFSNYGKNTVDVFAPGINIYSTIPGNGYKTESGTSMAAPVVSGLAALIRSYFPQMGANDVKKIILDSVKKVNHKVRDKSGNLIDFSDSCNSGGVVNAYIAIGMAKKLYGFKE